jgi:hypothetical protein
MAAPVPAKAAAIVVKVVRREVQSATVQLHRDGRLVASEKVEGTRQSVRFTNLIGDTYAVSVVAPKAVGSYTVVTTRSPSRTIVLGITAVHADKSRAVRGVFTPGRPLVLRATDAAGIHYQLELPADALSSATTIEMTPLTGMPGPGLSNGKGVELAPSGLKLRGSARLTVKGGTFKRLPFLFNYVASTAGWSPQIPLPELADETNETGRVYAITHFSKYKEYTILDCSIQGCLVGEKNTYYPPGDVLPGEASSAAQFYEQLGNFGDMGIWAAVNYIDSHRGILDQLHDPYENKVSAATRDQLRKLADADSAAACAHGPDEASFYLAALTSDLAFFVANRPPSLKEAALRCIPVFRQYGNADCYDGADNQDANQRRIGERRLYFAIFMASRAAMRIPLGRNIYDTDVQACTGYNVDAVYHDPYIANTDITIVHAFTCATLIRKSHWDGLGGSLNAEDFVPIHFEIEDNSRFEWLPPYETLFVFGPDEATLRIENWGVADIPHAITFHLQIVSSSNPSFVPPGDNSPVRAEIKYGVKGVPEQDCLPATYPDTSFFTPDGLNHRYPGENVGEPGRGQQREVFLGGRG